jgi:uncharacterized protein
MNAQDSIVQFSKMLKNLDRWIEMAAGFADQKKFDQEILLGLRLAPDQFPFVKQVQSACDAAKFAGAYLTGQKAPAHPDTEKTVAELRARIQSCCTYIDGLAAADFAGADERKVAPPWMGGKWILGKDYLLQGGTPNFYFHVTTAYAILRHNGVPLGKINYMGSLPTNDP